MTHAKPTVAITAGVLLASVLALLSARRPSLALEPLVAQPTQGRYALGRHLEYFEDAQRQWTIDDVTSAQLAPRFVPGTADILNFGLTASAYWIRFRLENPRTDPVTWLLEFDWIWVESSGVPGEGATFSFTIVAEGSMEPIRRIDCSYDHFLRGKRVLVVDDNARNRRMVELQTRAWEMTAIAAASGPEALARLDQGQRFDLALLDLIMPDMDGIELAVEMRRRAPDLPLIMISSVGRPDGDLAVLAEFKTFLTKPVKQSQLHDALVGVWAGDEALQLTAEPRESEFDRTLGERLPLRILLAEDNSVNQQVAIRFLRRMGYEADAVANGLEAVDAVRRRAYDVILMDVHMPEMDGLEASQVICKEHGDGRPHIIAMTANALQGDRERCLAAGMGDYVSKPIRISELQSALTVAAERIHARGDATPRRPPPTASPRDVDLDRQAILDPSAFQEMREFLQEEADDLIANVLGSFRERTPQMIAAMHEAVDRGDSQQLQYLAHTLKGLSGTIGARRVQALSEQIEASATRNALNDARSPGRGVRDGAGRVGARDVVPPPNGFAPEVGAMGPSYRRKPVSRRGRGDGYWIPASAGMTTGSARDFFLQSRSEASTSTPDLSSSRRRWWPMLESQR